MLRARNARDSDRAPQHSQTSHPSSLLMVQPLHFFAFSLAITSSCSSPPESKTPVPPATCEELPPRIVIGAGGRLNTEPGSPGLPVQLKLYQLTTEDALREGFFDDIWADDSAVLGESLLETRKVTVFPDTTQQFTWPRNPRANTLSAVALFREPRGRDWLVSFDFPAGTATAPCPSQGPLLTLWLDRMKIQDGAGRVAPPLPEASARNQNQREN